MSVGRISLFCHRCDKDLEIREEDLKRVQRRQPEAFETLNGLLHYRGGCFFKTLGRLRKEERLPTGCECKQ